MRDRVTKEPLAAYGGSCDGDERGRRRPQSGRVLPFANFNRIHVVPPLNIGDADLRFGLDVLDQALDIADGFVA